MTMLLVLGMSGCQDTKKAETKQNGPTLFSMVKFPASYKMSEKVKSRIEMYAMVDGRLKTLIKDPEKYPKILFQMLYVNIETLGFVAKYPQNKGQVSTDTIGNFKKGEIPLLLQWDERWGYGTYGDTFIAAGGCGPTSLAMVIAGLSGRKDVTPYRIGQYAEKAGYYVRGMGSSWDLISDGGDAFGVHATAMGDDKNSIFFRLKQGHPIICSVTKGVFTTEGHFIVLTGIEDGKIKVNDPNSYLRSTRLWNFEEFDDQIAACWYFTKK